MTVASARAISVVVFDFDGTLVDSNGLKHRAYAVAFGAVPGAAKLIGPALRAHPDKDRRFIVESIVTRLERNGDLGTADAAALVRRVLRRYSRVCLKSVSAARDFPGVATTLPALAKRYRIAVNSGTQQRQLRQLVGRRDWGAYCEVVLGSPATKIRNLRRIAASFKVQPAQVVLVGDSPVDAAAANEFGCRFIYMAHGGAKIPPPWCGVSSFRRLPFVISSLSR